jgi:hypothetical protein
MIIVSIVREKTAWIEHAALRDVAVIQEGQQEGNFDYEHAA